jgi:hypothetical protein
MSVARCTGAGVSELSTSGARGQSTDAAVEGGRGEVPFMVIVGLSAGGAGTADRSYPHAPQKRSPASSGSSQLGHRERAVGWGIWDINHTHVRGR